MNVQLIMTELISNAVAASHATGTLELGVHVVEADMIIEVTDRAAGAPQIRHMSGLAENGRGLRIIEELTRAWGWRPIPEGKVVWGVVPYTEASNSAAPS